MQIDQRVEQRRGLILSAGLVIILLLMHFPGVLFPAPPGTENRRLATLPKWPESLRDLQSFTRGIDAFVKDYFPARRRLIGGLNWLRYWVVDSGVSSVLVGRQGWLYLDNGTHLGMVGALPRKGEIDRWAAQIDQWTRAVAKGGGQFYLLIPPDKERVYPEYAPNWFVPLPNPPAEQLMRGAQARGLENVLYLLPEILRAKSESPPAYGPHDTHWTGHAAHAAYLALAEHLRTTDSPISAWPLVRYTRLSMNPEEDLKKMLGFNGWNTALPFPLLNHPETVTRVQKTWLTEKQDSRSSFIAELGNADGPTLLLIGDSFSAALLPVLQPHFRRIIFSHSQEGIFRSDLIDRFAPDVVVLEVVERDLVPMLRIATK